MRIALLCLSLTIGIAGTSLAQSATPTTSPSNQDGIAITPSTLPSGTPPRYTVPRWNEDYGYLQNPSNQTDCMDPIKFIPLNANGDWYASFGGQIRDRYEYFNHNLFGTGPQTRDGYNLARITENLDLHFGPDLRVFLQGATLSRPAAMAVPDPTIGTNSIWSRGLPTI